MKKESIKIFSPATVANVSCGFDVLGFCLDSIGDEMVIHKTAEKGIRIIKIDGYDLPYTAEENVAGISALALMKDANPNCGFEIEIYKNIKPGSGIGSSSASAAGSVFGMNALLGNPYTKIQLTEFAMQGEAFASKCMHADNLAPGIFGGFTLVKSCNPLQVIELPTPADLHAVIIHPKIEIKTSEARAILPKMVSLSNAIEQWSNVGSLVHALHTSNYQLLGDSLKDVIVEPLRSQMIPKFNEVKSQALKAGALGCGISGSGPSIFSLCQGYENSMKVADELTKVYSKTDIEFDIYVSSINKKGIRLMNENASD